MALGIPSLKAQLDKQGGGEQQQKKKVKKEAGEFKPRVKHEPGAPEAPTRRSSRLLDAVEHPKPKPETGECCVGVWDACGQAALGACFGHQLSLPCTHPPTAEERQQRELGLFAVEGACPRCGKELERPASQRAHLAACGGPRPPRQPRAADADELEVRGGRPHLGLPRAGTTGAGAVQGPPRHLPLPTTPHHTTRCVTPQDLTEEQRADQYQRTLARMKKVGGLRRCTCARR